MAWQSMTCELSSRLDCSSTRAHDAWAFRGVLTKLDHYIGPSRGLMVVGEVGRADPADRTLAICCSSTVESRFQSHAKQIAAPLAQLGGQILPPTRSMTPDGSGDVSRLLLATPIPLLQSLPTSEQRSCRLALSVASRFIFEVGRDPVDGYYW